LCAALEKFGDNKKLSDSLRNGLQQIASYLSKVPDAKEHAGDGWEALFMATLLMRAHAGKFDASCFRLRGLGKSYGVSFQVPFKGHDAHLITYVDEFVNRITKPKTFPHVAIYYPDHASFEEVDVIVAVWESETSKRRLFGYQLKEGKTMPEKAGNVVFEKCWPIRGDPPENATKCRNWQPYNQSDADEFFGLSGSRWTPTEWVHLNQAVVVQSPETKKQKTNDKPKNKTKKTTKKTKNKRNKQTNKGNMK
jgi:hypothetical protein